MLIEVKVPAVGESITEGLLAEWSRQDGDAVKADEPLFVLETDKVTMTVNAEHSGKLSISVAAGSPVKIGETVATLDTDAKGVEPSGPPVPQPAGVPQTSGPPLNPIAGMPTAKAKLAGMTSPDEYPPSVRRMLEEFRLDGSAISGTGRGGRLTKEDVVKFLETARPGGTAPPAGNERESGGAGERGMEAGEPSPKTTVPGVGERQTRTPMTPLRARIAERLLLAKNSTAMLTTFNEVDMTAVLALRERHRESFKAKHGVDLGFMSFFVKATVEALAAVPALNAQIQGDDIVQNHYYDIGVAVSSEKGLVVPVVRDADTLNFAEVEQAIAGLARRVRERTITLAELTGGVFTISNGGIYGNLLSTPILNPPQSGILGMHVIKKRPVVVDDQIVIRPMMYLAVSYDHRLVDGREAVTFLKHIIAGIENPERLLLEI